ncbi:efflux RND transporter permease subunit [Hyphobacterium sp. HN65]|uniref:Efflux RND transporter permease subunit n=1 Tax=Hyphobacterium lacteum TaxID=3116575 RepID=A0ABU7LTL8_9PROT|nr:efflux RND transporter permease subunit [Hyphobacterium sp. HN65]MEE2527262.1 efflux RND transporter permease subunit [Hyphobacterium sp. HN65]
MATLFYRFSRLSILAVILLVIAGLGAFFTLGRQEDPSLTERFGVIVTPFPGASAERVEALITDPIEDSIRELPEVDEVVSTSRSGMSLININIREDLSATEVDQTWTQIREQVDAVRPVLPAEAGTPDVRRQYIGAATMIVSLGWRADGDPNMAILSRLAGDLEDRLTNISGTEETRLFGIAEEEIRVLADPDALAALGLTVGDLAGLVSQADAKTPAGELRTGDVNLNVEIGGEFETLDRIRTVPVIESDDGQFVRLGDIAEIERGVRTPEQAMAYFNGDRVVYVAGFLQPELRVDVWSDRAREVVNIFAAENPGVIVDIVFAQSDYVEARLNGLSVNLGYSALIVFAVLFLLMGWRAALIVGSALPLTVLFVLFLIRVFDEPLHQMSVTGLVVALGLLIDNAIVVVDEYQLMRAKGLPPLDAINKSLKHLFGPLLASTLTTVFAFAPIALMPGAAGEFIGMIGVSVIFAVVASFILAMTVVPAFAGWFDHDNYAEGRKSFLRDGLRFKPLEYFYRGILQAVTSRPWVGLVGGVILPVAGFAAATTLPMQFFPPTDRDMFQIEMVLPANTSIAETQRQVLRATELIEAYDGVIDVGWTLGESPPRTYYNVIGNESAAPYLAAGWVRTASPEVTHDLLPQLQHDMIAAFPQARFLTLPFEQGPPTAAPIELKIFGPDLATLDRLGDEIRHILAATPGVTATVAGMRMGEPVARVNVDEASAELAGIRLDNLASRLRADFDGVPGGSILEGVEEMPVRVIAAENRRASVSDLSSAPLLTEPDSGILSAPVSALGSVGLSPEVASIRRQDGERMNPIYAYLEPFSLPAPVLEDFMARLDAAGVELPPGYTLQIGGEAEARGDAIGNLFGTAGPLLILMIGSVVLAFNSFRLAGVVFVTGFLSVGLALFGVWMFNTPLGFNAIVGSMGLVGLSINGTIVVLSALRANPAANALDLQAIEDTVVDATRHIISTTLTTIGGFVPLILSGDSFWLPFAAAVAGGVAGSALLALIFAPAAFVMLARARQKRREFHARLKKRVRRGALMQPAE